MTLILTLILLTNSTFIITNEILNEYFPFVGFIYLYFQRVTSSLSISPYMHTIIRVYCNKPPSTASEITNDHYLNCMWLLQFLYQNAPMNGVGGGGGEGELIHSSRWLWLE